MSDLPGPQDAPGGWAPPSPPAPQPPRPPAVAAPLTPPPGFPTDATPPAVGATSWWRRRAAGLPVGAWVGVALVAVAAIVAVALVAGGGDEPKLAIDVTGLTTLAPAPTTTAAAAEPPARTNPATTPATAVPATSGPATSVAATTPDSGPPASVVIGDGTKPDEPLPAGDASSAFRYDDTFGSVWAGTITGVVETPLYWDDDEGERCFVVLGTLTPEQFDGLVSDSWSTPYLTLFVGGDEAELGELMCDTAALADAGYRSLYDTSATVGTEVAFYAEFSLADSLGVPQAVAVGQGGDEWLFFDATLLDDVPAPVPGPVGELTVDPVAIGDGAPGPFAATDEYTGDVWSGTVVGLVETPLDEFAEEPGRCYTVLATATADVAGSGFTTSPYAAPPIGLIADGRLLDDAYGCAAAEVEEAGYAWFNDSEVTGGTTLQVYGQVLIPAPLPGDLQAIVVGDPWGEAPTVLDPFVLPDIPPATVTPGPPPATELAPAGMPVTVVQEYEETTWEVVVHGYVVTGDCVVVYATSTLTDGGQDEIPPEVYVIAGGRVVYESYDCDTSAATGAGYVEQWGEVPGPGAQLHTFAAFRVAPEFGPLQATVVGHALNTDPVAVQPAQISAPPPIPG